MADYMAHTLVGDNNRDVVLLQEMLEQSEKEEQELKAKKKQALAGEIFDGEGAEQGSGGGDAAGLDSWLNQIQERDRELRKIQEAKRAAPADKLPPVRNSKGREKKVQVGPSDIEKEKADKKQGQAAERAEKGPSKHQKYYQYDYFKEWDKFDVDNELKRLEEEDRKRDEHAKFAKKTADPFESAQQAAQAEDASQGYRVESMTPLERRMAAQREKEKGNECMRCGETNAAVAYYSKSLDLSPGDHLVLGNRAQAYIGIHCYLQAEMDCDQALAIEPSYHKARYRRAVACKEQGKYDEAVKDLEAVVEADPSAKAAGAMLEECRKRGQAKREEEERKRKAEEERKRYEAAPRRKIAIQEVEDDEDEADDDGLDSGAMAQARESVRLKKEAEERLLKLEAAKRKKDEGNAAVRKRDFSNAVRLYSAALKVLPEGDTTESFLVLSNRAHVYLQQGEFELAEADCTAALAANSSWAKARHRRGVARSGLGRYDEALQDLEAALKLEGDSQQTMEEIRRVRQLQAEKRRDQAAAAHKAPTRVQIEEVDGSDSEEEVEIQGAATRVSVSVEEGDTDSSDDDVIVINKATAQGSPGRVKRVPITEVDDDDEEEGCLIHDDAPVTAAAPTPTPTRAAPAQAAPAKAPPAAPAQAPPAQPPAAVLQPKPAAPAKGGGGRRLAIEVVESDSDDQTDDDEEKAAPAPPAPEPTPAPAATPAPASERRVRVEVVESDSDDQTDEEEDKAAPAPPAPAPVEEPKREAWEAAGRDAARLARARGLKEGADAQFKKGLFEQAAEAYGEAAAALGEGDEYVQEAALCYGNRAACRLQIRDYGAAIADCMEVLGHDEGNVKALVRRAMAYEGLERYSKAAADCREALSIEFAAGGGLTALGHKARECLERCKKHDPAQRGIPIPVRAPPAGGARPASPPAPAPTPAPPAPTHPAAQPKPAEEPPAPPARRGGAAPPPAAKEAKGPPVFEEGGVGKRDLEAEVAAERAAAAAAVREARVREACACKERGNVAFKAGKHHNAIMHYSAAIDLVDDDPAFYTNLAAAHYALKDYTNALRMGEKALKLDGGNAKGHYRKGQALEALGLLGEAEGAFAAGLAALPQSEQLKQGLEGVRERLRAKERAEADALAKIREQGKKREEAEAKAASAAMARAAPTPTPASGASARKAVQPAAVGLGGGGGVTASGFKKQCRALRRDLAGLYKYLRTVPAGGLGKLLVSGVDEEEFVPVLHALEQHGLATDAPHAFAFLQGVSRVPRVGIVCKMLDKADARALEGMLLRLHPAKAAEGGATVTYSTEEWAAVRQALGV